MLLPSSLFSFHNSNQDQQKVMVAAAERNQMGESNHAVVEWAPPPLVIGTERKGVSKDSFALQCRIATRENFFFCITFKKGQTSFAPGHPRLLKKKKYVKLQNRFTPEVWSKYVPAYCQLLLYLESCSYTCLLLAAPQLQQKQGLC